MRAFAGAAAAVAVVAAVGFAAKSRIADMTRGETRPTPSGAAHAADHPKQSAERSLAVLERTLPALRAKLGEDASLLEASVSTGGYVNVKYARGDNAAGGFRAGPDGHLQPVSVKIEGSGSLSDAAFPIGQLRPDVLRSLIDRVSARDGSFELTTATLLRNASDGELRWIIGGETPTRTGLSYTATPAGSGLKKLS